VEHFYQRIHGCFTFAHFYRWIAQNTSLESFHGVEVGALFGQSAAFLGVELCNRQESFHELDTDYGHYKLDLVDLSNNGDRLRHNLAPVASVIGAIHSPCSSLAASMKYPDVSLDFVMLDAGHDYGDIRADIDAWWPKVKSGGILSGHDFSHYFPGIVRAVCETFAEVRVWPGSLWPDETVEEPRLSEARRDIETRSAKHEAVDYMPVWWVRK
jgi:hypothetical protein